MLVIFHFTTLLREFNVYMSLATVLAKYGWEISSTWFQPFEAIKVWTKHCASINHFKWETTWASEHCSILRKQPFVGNKPTDSKVLYTQQQGIHNKYWATVLGTH